MTGCRALTDPFIDIVGSSVDWKKKEVTGSEEVEEYESQKSIVKNQLQLGM